jgi:hypothetical protein
MTVMRLRTEEEWWTGDDFELMVSPLLEGKLSARKVRLFACACCRAIGEWLQDPRIWTAIETAERYADGMASGEELTVAWDATVAVRKERNRALYAGRHELTQAERASLQLQASGASAAAAASNPGDGESSGWLSARMAALSALGIAIQQTSTLKRKKGLEKAYRKRFAEFMRHIVGNPFRPVAVNPAWLTPAVVQLARAVYDERRFAELPVLADALEEVDCTDAEILGHCRGPGPHPLGCWVVDSLLGKG